MIRHHHDWRVVQDIGGKKRDKNDDDDTHTVIIVMKNNTPLTSAWINTKEIKTWKSISLLLFVYNETYSYAKGIYFSIQIELAMRNYLLSKVR